jgi:hypothetical protein
MIVTPSYFSAVERCGINASDLEGKPAFHVVFNKFLKWLHNLLKRVRQKTGDSYFPGNNVLYFGCHLHLRDKHFKLIHYLFSYEMFMFPKSI